MSSRRSRGPNGFKAPAYQWYPGDFRRDTALMACSFEARALWRAMLDLMHDGEPYGHLTAGRVPLLPTQLARLEGVGARKVTAWLAELESHGVFSRTDDGVIYSRRMVRDEHNRRARAEGGVKSLDNPNVPRPKSERERIPSDDPSSGPSAGTFTGSFDPSPAFAVCGLRSASASTPPPLPPAGDHVSEIEQRLRERISAEAADALLSVIPRGSAARAASLSDVHAQLDEGVAAACVEQAVRELVAKGDPFSVPRLRSYVHNVVRRGQEQSERNRDRASGGRRRRIAATGGEREAWKLEYDA